MRKPVVSVDGDEQVVGPQVDVVPELLTVPQKLMCGQQGVDEKMDEHQQRIPQYIHLMYCAMRCSPHLLLSP